VQVAVDERCGDEPALALDRPLGVEVEGRADPCPAAAVGEQVRQAFGVDQAGVPKQ
jgi:hypothetical protein